MSASAHRKVTEAPTTFARGALLSVGVLALLLTSLAPMAGASVAHPQVSPGGVWEQFHGDPTLDGVSGSGSTPTNASLFAPVDLTRYASFGTVTNNPYPYQASPVTDGSVVVVAIGNYLLEFSATSGAQVSGWPTAALPGGPNGGPLVGTPLMTPTAIYVDQAAGNGAGASMVFAINPTNGSILWQSAPQTCGFSCSSSSSVAIGAGSLAVATLGGELAWHPPSAGNLWTYQAANGGAIYDATPAYTFIAGLDVSAFVLPSLFGGLEAFQAPPLGGNVAGFPASPPGGFGETLSSSAAVVNLTSGGTVNTWAFFGGDAGNGASSHLWAVDLSQPSVIASVTIPPLGNPSDGVMGTPTVVVSPTNPNHASVYFATLDGQVMNATFSWNGGTQTGFTRGWSFQAPVSTSFYASPVVAGSDVLVPGNDAQGTLYAVTTSGGVLDWTARTGSPVYASPAVSGGAVYIVTSAGKLYGFGYSPGPGSNSTNGGNASGSDLVYALLAALVVIVIVALVVVYVVSRRHHPHVPAHSGHGTHPAPVSTWSPPPPPSSSGAPPPPPPSSSYPPPPGHGGSGVPPPPTTAEVAYDEPSGG